MLGWKILVVDDDPDIRRIAALSLERVGGFRVAMAASAEEALQRATEEAPNLVLLDVSMPGADGPTTLVALRALPTMSAVPVIFFTAEANEEQLLRLRNLGAIGIITKPFDVADLPARIQRIVSRAGVH